MDLSQLLQITIDKGASDLHLVSGYFPSIRINNELLYLRNFGVATPDQIETMVFSILAPEQKTYLHENKEMDFGYSYKENRFRINAYTNNRSFAAAFRLIPQRIKPIEELNLPDILHSFCERKQGLILFTGPTGEGKSTSLASIINEINLKFAKHIITIEDPVEFVYPVERSIISQRELHHDTLSWGTALKSVLREDPDVVLVGEMRDFDTISSVLTVAETGHLVFSTLHTGSAHETIDRIVDVFPAHQQNQIRITLANTLLAVVAQRLIPDSDGLGRVPALEILINLPSVSSIIREGKTHMIDNVIETSEDKGMVLFEKYLLQLYQKGRISRETAYTYALRKNVIEKLIP